MHLYNHCLSPANVARLAIPVSTIEFDGGAQISSHAPYIPQSGLDFIRGAPSLHIYQSYELNESEWPISGLPCISNNPFHPSAQTSLPWPVRIGFPSAPPSTKPSTWPRRAPRAETERIAAQDVHSECTCWTRPIRRRW